MRISMSINISWIRYSEIQTYRQCTHFLPYMYIDRFLHITHRLYIRKHQLKISVQKTFFHDPIDEI